MPGRENGELDQILPHESSPDSPVIGKGAALATDITHAIAVGSVRWRC